MIIGASILITGSVMNVTEVEEVIYGGKVLCQDCTQGWKSGCSSCSSVDSGYGRKPVVVAAAVAAAVVVGRHIIFLILRNHRVALRSKFYKPLVCVIYFLMGDAENDLQPSKKRAAGRQLSRDDPGLDDGEDGSGQETGTFKKASEEVLANRRIVKVRRRESSSAAPTPSSNPFAGIRLVPPTVSSVAPKESNVLAENKKNISEEAEGKNDVNEEIKETEVEKKDNDKQLESKTDESEVDSAAEKAKNEIVYEAPKAELSEATAADGDETESEAKKDTEGKRRNIEEKDNEGENLQKGTEAAPFSSFQQLSSGQNAFTGLAGTGFSSSTFSFGSIPKDGSLLGSNSGSVFRQKSDQPSIPSFGFGVSNNGNSSLSGDGVNKSEGSGISSMQEVPIETGEENEKAVFAADSVLFEFFDGGWKERGKGEVKVNVSTNGTGKARLVMRSKGNYRLILNASLYPDMKLANMEKRGITFACVNSMGEGQDGLSTFALKFRDSSIVEEFRVAVTENKGKAAVALKTPENSPKALDE
ncbi:hypothetical protein LguiA_028641 [Lonicera macranthoides]